MVLRICLVLLQLSVCKWQAKLKLGAKIGFAANLYGSSHHLDNLSADCKA